MFKTYSVCMNSKDVETQSGQIVEPLIDAVIPVLYNSLTIIVKRFSVFGSP